MGKSENLYQRVFGCYARGWIFFETYSRNAIFRRANVTFDGCQLWICIGSNGQKSPVGFGESEKTTDKSKANVTKLVLAGYDFAIESIKKMSPSQLNEQVKLFGRFEMTKGLALAKCFEHQTHHRGQTTVYIRLAGAKPPQEKLF